MSKLFLRSLYLMLLTLCLPSMASAETVAKIGAIEYESLAAAVTAANAGETVSIVTAGTYTMPSTSKNITVQGDVAGVTFDYASVYEGNIASFANGVTFKDVTFNITGNQDYYGFKNSGTINMDGCTLKGKFFSYGDMNFTNCQFEHSGDYHMWVYGPGTVTYTNCTFTNNGKFLHLYRESPDIVAVVNIKNCKFINNGSTANKAAVNVKATSGSNILSNTVNIDDESTTVGAFPEPGVRNNSDNTDVISSLVQVDDRKVAASSEKITVNVENVPVYQNGVETEVVKINTVDDLKAFRDAVNSVTSYAGKIVRLMADLDLSSEANWTPIGNLAAYPGVSFKGTFDGNGHIISNLTVNDNTPKYAVAALFGSIEEGSIVNLTVKDVNITSTHYAAGIVAYTSNAPSIINCHVVGGTITSTPELLSEGYDNGDKAGGIMGYCTAGTTIKDCTVEGVTITAYRDLAGICGFANGSVADCTVKDVTVVQDNTNAYKTDDQASTACEVVGGRSANAAATNSGNGNTTENVIITHPVSGVAQIGTTKYETLQAAIDAAQAGDVIELLQDIDLTTVTTTPNNKYNVNVNKSITIDGKGYKITSSEGKRALALTGEGNDIMLKNLTVVNNKADWGMGILNALTCTLDNTTIDGTNYKGSYNQPLTIGSIADAGHVTLNVTNGSVIKTNEAGSAHYAIIVAHPADITVTNSSLIGWANVYLKPDAEGSTVNISNSTLKSQGVAGASNNFSMFTTECGNNTITLTDNNISLTPAADTYMTLVTLNGTANNTVKVEGDKTTFTTTDVTRGGISYRKGDFDGNTVTFDEDAHTAFAEAIDVLKNEGVSDTKAEGVYTLGYVTEVYYYWYVNDVEAGGNHDFAEPFKKGWLADGEFIRLKKDVTLTENLTWANENASFTLTLGEYSVTKGQYSVALKAGASVNTDKQTDIFTATNSAYTVKETAVEGGYTYAVVERSFVAQIGETKYETLEEAIAAAQDGDEVTLLANCAGNGISINKSVTIDFATYTYTITGPSLAGSTGTKTQAFQLLKNNTITFKNGAIVGDNSDVKMLIQNYSNLTLDNMVLDATQGTNSVGYVLSTNNGSTTIKDTQITAKSTGTAFDACSGWGGYTSNAVEVTGNSVITGNVEVSYYGETGTNPAALTLTSGTLTGNIVMAKGADQATVTKANTFEQAAPEGYEWKDNSDGTSTLVEATDIELANNGDNSAVITAANGKVRNVTLKGRTLYKDNCWNTICLPFDVTINAESPLAGATVKELDAANSGYVAATNVLRINFKDAETDNDGNVVLKANTPYLLKWTSGNNVVAPVFNGVTVESGEAKAVSSDGELEFVGTASTVTLEGAKYAYFGNNNKLLYVDAPTGKKIYTCRAYFYLPNQDFKAVLDEASGAKSFVLSFGDDDDDITRVAAVAGQQKAEDDVYYDLQGRKIVGQPTVSGIYVKNGVKVYVK